MTIYRIKVKVTRGLVLSNTVLFYKYEKVYANRLFGFDASLQNCTY